MLDGRTKLVEKEKLQYRPAAYAILLHRDRILLLKTRTTGRYAVPGGGVELGESLIEGLKREVIEETGIEIKVGGLIHFSEEFFYYEPTDEAFQSYRFFYHCKPNTLTLVRDNEVDDEEVEMPRWVPIEGLNAGHFQDHGDMILSYLRKMETEN